MENEVENWQEISRKELLRKYSRGMDAVQFRLPNNKELEFSLFSELKSIACVALTTDNQVILAKQYRPGPKQVLLEIPGGGLKAGESPEMAMERELLEETGYKGKMQFVTELFHHGYSNRIKCVLVATDCVKVAEPLPEDNGEKITAVRMSLEDFRKHLRSGRLTDVEVGYLGLDHLGLL
jgi:ADP-ribose pyrophosphatase